MPADYVIDALLEDEIKSCAKAVEELNGGSVRPISAELVEL